MVPYIKGEPVPWMSLGGKDSFQFLPFHFPILSWKDQYLPHYPKGKETEQCQPSPVPTRIEGQRQSSPR